MFFLTPTLILLLLVFIVSVVGVRYMISLGVQDVPNERSAHKVSTPKGGGVGVIIALLMGMMGWPLFGDTPFFPHGTGFLAAALILLSIVSWLDDMYQWPPSIKFSAQMLAAALVISGGFHFPFFNDNKIGQILILLLSIMWLVFVTNAINFMDGLNGLVAGAMALISLMAGTGLFYSIFPVAWGLIFCAALLGFLPFNFPKARIFLGDAGSQPGGLLMGVFCFASYNPFIPLYWTMLIIPMMLCGLLYDVTFTLIRRFFAGNPLIQAHKGHLYQLAYRCGVPAPLITFIHLGFILWGALAAILGCIHPFSVLRSILLGGSIILIQGIWTYYVIKRARHSAIGKW